MADYTRRTHIVRIYPKDDKGTKDKSRFIDVEVLDSVAFSIDRGKQVVLDMPAKKAKPYIVDKTDADEGKQPAKATRRTHVEKLKGDDGSILYVEIFDAAAYRDARGEEWIITGPDAKPYDLTDDTGADGATRRCHDEKISASKPSDHHPTSNYITVQRTDMLAFRSIRGKEMIIKMPSADDESADRAKTYIWNMPNNEYDPTSDDPDKAPPENEDPHFYVKFDPKGASPVLGKEKIKQGPFWWIRRVKSGGNILIITLDTGGFGGSFNTLRNASHFDANPAASVNTGQVDWTADSKDVKINAYFSGALEFVSRDETLVFEVPKGDFRIDIKGLNPMDANATAAIYATQAKAFSIFEGETLNETSDGGGSGTWSAPKPLAHTDPEEVDPASCNWGFPSAYVVPGGDSFPESVNGMFGTYTVNPGSVPFGAPLTNGGGYSVVDGISKSTKTDRSWIRSTKFYQPGKVDGYETVINYGKGLDTSLNGSDIPFTLYVTLKGGKLKISTTPPAPPPTS